MAACASSCSPRDPISLAEANSRLQEEGFRGVMRLDEVRRGRQSPLLGTGKTDYKVLRALIATEQPEAGGLGSYGPGLWRTRDCNHASFRGRNGLLFAST